MNGDDNDGKGQQKVELIPQPNVLKTKVGGRGGPTKEMLANAEKAIDEMSQQYPTWALDDVNTLDEIVQATEPGAGKGRERMERAFKLAHDMRGQGGSFGYPLITRIANSFCRFVESLDDVDEGAIEICAAHVKSMRAVLQNKVKGTGGPIGAQIADGLETAVKKYNDKK